MSVQPSIRLKFPDDVLVQGRVAVVDREHALVLRADLTRSLYGVELPASAVVPVQVNKSAAAPTPPQSSIVADDLFSTAPGVVEDAETPAVQDTAPVHGKQKVTRRKLDTRGQLKDPDFHTCVRYLDRRGYNGSQIAGTLATSQSTVSRVLIKAKARVAADEKEQST